MKNLENKTRKELIKEIMKLKQKVIYYEEKSDERELRNKQLIKDLKKLDLLFSITDDK